MKRVLILISCIMLFPGVLYANPSPAIYISEYSTEENWIEVYGIVNGLHGSAFTVNGDTITIDDDVTFMYPLCLLNQENTSGFDLPEDGGTIEFLKYWASISYGTHGYYPAPPRSASAAFHLIEPPGWSDSSAQTVWNLDFSPTPGERNDHPLPAYGEGTVFLNEFRPGSSSGEDASPFVELFNRSDEALDIGGWRISAGSLYVVPAGTVIVGHGFFVADGADLPEEFFTSPASGTIYLTNEKEELVDQAGFTEEPDDGETLIRYPDGFTTKFNGYNSATSVDYRAGEPTMGYANQAKYSIVSIATELDSLFVSPGADARAYCRGVDSGGRSVRIKPEWSLSGDVAKIDEDGWLTYLAYGNGILTASYGGLSDDMKIHCAVGGYIRRDCTWTASGSPYILEWNVIVNEGVTLTVEPGTEIIGNPYISITCDGLLDMEGEESAPIVFTVDETRRAHIYLYGESCTMRYCDFATCNTNLRVSTRRNQSPESRNEISHCSFSTDEGGIFIYSATAMSHCFINGRSRATGKGVTIDYNENIEFMNNIVTDCDAAVIVLESNTRISNNIITDSNIGILTADGIAADILYNNLYNIDQYFVGAASAYGSLTTTNANDHPCDIYCNIIADPLFVDAKAGDYRLAAGSPCIDAGDPSLADEDGTVSDMGIYGGALAVGVNDTEAVPAVFSLAQNHPNPFNPATTIGYTLPGDSRVTVTIHNIAGQRIATLVEGRQAAGNHAIVWDASDMPSGIYFCTVAAGKHRATRKMLLLK